MPPKRKSNAAGGAAKKAATRLSKLAREHNVTAQEEGEIREAWSLFSEPLDGERDGVLPVDDVKSALTYVVNRPLRPPFPPKRACSDGHGPRRVFECIHNQDDWRHWRLTRRRALGIPPSSPAELVEFLSILDPSSDGFATFEPFFAICALKLHERAAADGGDAHRAALVEAFRLFTNGTDGPISLAHLRRVAALLKEDVDDELLKDMILEANSGAGVARGVAMNEFDEVMRNAGVWR
ncbi:calmodulin [Drechmeria coniospora]|uniref:Calmodulin n=1 Tax=Drechmeria coniospora TaxID=98403 RepID=A0A151GF11_DRECN|nr:calmodulin [Drechmeria coniospora]KYK55652.1 calmodulin [Drechmeria coniospora]ODA81746.1 hypothetical protein RJ55_00249 [Drechmeria coniospora]